MRILSKHPADVTLHVSHGSSRHSWVFLFCLAKSIQQIYKVVKDVFECCGTAFAVGRPAFAAKL